MVGLKAFLIVAGANIAETLIAAKMQEDVLIVPSGLLR